MASRTLKVNVTGDARSLNRVLGRSSSRVGKFGKLAGAALIGAGTAAAAFGVKAVMAASDLEETLSKTDQVFGESSKKVRKFADDMAAAYGLPKAEILDAASNIGLVGKASGLSEKAAAGMSTKMAGLAADASSFFNVPLPDALEKIRAGLVGEAEPLRSFGVLLSAAAVEQEAVRMGIAGSGEELTEQQKVMARASIITRDMSDASGDLERTQDSLSNRMRELRGRSENFAAAVGQKLIPIVLDAFDLFEDHILPALQQFGEWIGPKLEPVLQGFGKLVGDTFTAVVDAVEFVSDVWDKVFGKGGSLPAATDDNRKFVEKTWRQISDHLSAVTEFIRALLETWAKVTTALWNRWGKDFIDFAKRAWAAIRQIFGGVLNVITGIVKAATSLLRGDWEGFHDALKQIASGAWAAVKGIVSLAWAAVETLFELGLAAVDAIWDTMWNALKTAASAGWRNIKGLFKKGLAATWDLVKSWGKTLVDWFKNLPFRIIDAVTGSNLGSGLQSAFSKALSGIKLNLPFSFSGDGPGRGGGGSAMSRARSLAGGLPISMTSSYRSPSHNAAVGGSPTSYHLDRGNPASDWAGPTWALDAFAARLRAAGGWRELIWRAPGHYDHVHVAHGGGRVDESWPTMPGLAADERPAILQTGETITPRGGAGMQVHVYIDGQEIRRALRIDRQSARAA